MGGLSLVPFVILLVSGLFCTTDAALRLAGKGRWPQWTTYLEIGAAIILVSGVTAAGARLHQDFAALYLWMMLYNSLYYGPRHAFTVLGLAGLAYAGVLTFGPTVAHPVTDWFVLMITAFFLCVIIVFMVGELERNSWEDSLTHLPNRRMWDKRLDEEWERAKRAGSALSLIVIDIDKFKMVNDVQGHQAGDRVLREFADGWSRTMRSAGDFIARIGGDEFAVMSPGSDLLKVRSLVGRLKEVAPDGVTSSFGTAAWDRHETAADLLRRADQAMYQAKYQRGSSQTQAADSERDWPSGGDGAGEEPLTGAVDCTEATSAPPTTP